MELFCDFIQNNRLSIFLETLSIGDKKFLIVNYNTLYNNGARDSFISIGIFI